MLLFCVEEDILFCERENILSNDANILIIFNFLIKKKTKLTTDRNFLNWAVS